MAAAGPQAARTGTGAGAGARTGARAGHGAQRHLKAVGWGEGGGVGQGCLGALDPVAGKAKGEGAVGVG